MIQFDELDFSECCSEEVMFLLTLSVDILINCIVFSFHALISPMVWGTAATIML